MGNKPGWRLLYGRRPTIGKEAKSDAKRSSFVRFYDQNYINRWFVWQCRQSKVSEYDDGARFRKAEKSVGWTGLFALESLH